MSDAQGAGQDWRPAAGPTALKARAQLLAKIRRFFAQRQVLEVDTPLLCQATITDPNIEPLACAERWLQTSPEYAMKRLLAAGSGPIYQVCKAFRAGEAGTRHNPEFTLLEWYRPDFDLEALMAEVAELVSGILGDIPCRHLDYGEMFLDILDIDPHRATELELAQRATALLDVSFEQADRDTWLDLLLTHCIEPVLADQGMVFVSGYPATQAALATLGRRHGREVALRFELYVNGIELANGYQELTDPAEQARRFESDNARLQSMGRAARAPDRRLAQAMEQGLPDCSGVALGLDRLLMLQLGEAEIANVVAFPWDSA